MKREINKDFGYNPAFCCGLKDFYAQEKCLHISSYDDKVMAVMVLCYVHMACKNIMWLESVL